MLDAANGVGALKIQKLTEYLEESLNITNTDIASKGKLNEKVKIIPLGKKEVF